jgi:hypothetical protein
MNAYAPISALSRRTGAGAGAEGPAHRFEPREMVASRTRPRKAAGRCSFSSPAAPTRG